MTKRKPVKCLWKIVAEEDSTTVQNPNDQMRFCKENCNGYQTTYTCYWNGMAKRAGDIDMGAKYGN